MKKSDPVRIAEIEALRDVTLTAISLVRDNPVISMVAGCTAVQVLAKNKILEGWVENLLIGVIVTTGTIEALKESGIARDIAIGMGGAAAAAAAAKLLLKKAAPPTVPAGFGGVSMFGAGLLLEPEKEYILRLTGRGGGEILETA